MRKLIFILFPIIVQAQNLKVPISDLNRYLTLKTGNHIFDDTLFSKSDTITYSGNGTVQCRLSKWHGAFFTMKTDRFSGKLKGRIVGDTIYYEYENGIFIEKDRSELIQNCNLGYGIPDSLEYYNAMGDNPTMAELHDQDSATIVDNDAIVIFLDFDGATPVGTTWGAAPGTVSPSIYSNSDTLDYIVAANRELYAPFNVVVTRDSTLWALQPTGRRIWIIITPDDDWYCGAGGPCTGGVGLINALSFGDDSPSFVFDAPLAGFNKVVTAIGHESGHQFGLRHQASLDGSGLTTSEYSDGYGTGETSFGSIMGSGYTRNLHIWWDGSMWTGSTGVFIYQDDVGIIAKNTTLRRGAGYSLSAGAVHWYNARCINKAQYVTGIIGANNDSDYYKISLGETETVSLAANVYNYGSSNLFARLKVGIDILDSKRNLIASSANTTTCNATLNRSLNAGDYYIIIRADAPTSTPSFMTNKTYGLMGHYSLTFNY